MTRTFGLSLARALALAVFTLGLSLSLAAGADARSGACTARPSRAGEWPLYGHDLANTRDQHRERGIGPASAGSLSAAWVFSTAAYGDRSSFESTPVVAGGCVFVASAVGDLYAIRATNGHLVWRRHLKVPSPGLGGAIVSAAGVAGPRAIFLINESGAPYAIAVSRSTGMVLWRSRPFIKRAGYYTNASPTIANGLVVAGYSDPEGNDHGSGGFALLNQRTGAIIKVTPTVSRADQKKGYAGGGLWDTPAYDARTGYLYYGTGNPDSKKKQDPHTNAIVKVDLRRHLSGGRRNPRFGQIVAAYPGNVDQYTNAFQSAAKTPACTVSDSSGAPWPLDDPVCGQLDLDFGASPTLFRNSRGAELVGDLQKAGVYHVANARTMAPAWHKVVGAPCAGCNAGSAAFDGNAIDVVGTPGSNLFSLARTGGAMNWASPLADGLHYESTSAAHGVVYAVDNNGFLTAFSAHTGAPLFKRQLSQDTGNPTGGGLTSNGVSIAEGKVFVAAGSPSGALASLGGSSAPSGPGAYVIAYR